MLFIYITWDDRFRLSVAFLTDGYSSILFIIGNNSYITFWNGIVHRKICILFSFVEKIIDFLFVSKIGRDFLYLYILKMRSLKLIFEKKIV